MANQYLYQQIIDRIRQRILEGELKPGERLPTLREMTRELDCTPGTVQRAYRELEQQGLITSRRGQGTRVAAIAPARGGEGLRRAQLVHAVETFMLEKLNAGIPLEEIEQAFSLAVDRWRVVDRMPPLSSRPVFTFSGSHDPVIAWMAGHFDTIAPGFSFQPHFSGSQNGLRDLAEGRADVAGCHLRDEASGEYNLPFVRQMFAGRETAVVEMAYRRIGLILAAGNPLKLHTLQDLAQKGVRMVNRQPGSGIRVWFDQQLKKEGVTAASLKGYTEERSTHWGVARAVAQDQADAGIGLEAAAAAYHLDFIPLTEERFDLVCLAEQAEWSPMREIIAWLGSEKGRGVMAQFPGYRASHPGAVTILPEK